MFRHKCAILRDINIVINCFLLSAFVVDILIYEYVWFVKYLIICQHCTVMTL